jgi:hypothetical protein
MSSGLATSENKINKPGVGIACSRTLADEFAVLSRGHRYSSSGGKRVSRHASQKTKSGSIAARQSRHTASW